MSDDGYLERRIAFYLWAIVSPILLVFGTLGNSLSILVLSRKTMRTSQASVYLIALSLADMLVLYTGLLRHFINEIFGIDVRTLSEAGCKINTMMVYLTLDLSVWILVAFTFERILSVFMPYKVKVYCTKLSSALVIACLVVILLALNCHFLYGFEDKYYTRRNITRMTPCTSINSNYRQFLIEKWPWIDFSVYSMVPFLILIVGNSCIAVRVLQTRRKARRVGTLETNTMECGHTTIASVMTPRNGFNPSPRIITRNDRTSSMTITLFVLNLVFLITTIPVSVYFIVSPSWTASITTRRHAALVKVTFTVVNLVQYVNNSINFILYCISGSRFRKELQTMLFWKWRRRILPVNPDQQTQEVSLHTHNLAPITARSEML